MDSSSCHHGTETPSSTHDWHLESISKMSRHLCCCLLTMLKFKACQNKKKPQAIHPRKLTNDNGTKQPWMTMYLLLKHGDAHPKCQPWWQTTTQKFMPCPPEKGTDPFQKGKDGLPMSSKQQAMASFQGNNSVNKNYALHVYWTSWLPTNPGSKKFPLVTCLISLLALSPQTTSNIQKWPFSGYPSSSKKLASHLSLEQPPTTKQSAHVAWGTSIWMEVSVVNPKWCINIIHT